MSDILKVLKGEASKVYKERKQREKSTIMDKYSQLKRFHHDLRLQVYIYAFMYVDPAKIPVEDHFTDTKIML